MKAIMMSIRPEWVELILNLIKKDEIRKGTAIGKAINRLIEEQGVAPTFIYCTKGKTTTINLETLLFGNPQNAIRNGRVVARFNATAEEIQWDYESPALSKYVTRDLDEWELCNKSCLTGKEMIEYLGKENKGTVIHINDLEIFDEPKELWKFMPAQPKWRKANGHFYKSFQLTRAPQSWCYVEI